MGGDKEIQDTNKLRADCRRKSAICRLRIRILRPPTCITAYIAADSFACSCRCVSACASSSSATLNGRGYHNNLILLLRSRLPLFSSRGQVFGSNLHFHECTRALILSQLKAKHAIYPHEFSSNYLLMSGVFMYPNCFYHGFFIIGKVATSIHGI